MCWLKTRILSVLLAAAATSLVLAADTGTPYPAGTSVEITTPAGTVSGVLEDRTTPGWVMLRETDRALPTAVPEKSIAFIRAQAPPPVLPPDVEKKEAPSDHYIHGRPRVTKPERFAFQPAPGGPLVEGITILKKHAFTGITTSTRTCAGSTVSPLRECTVEAILVSDVLYI